MNQNTVIWVSLAVVAGLGLSFWIKSGTAPNGEQASIKLPKFSTDANAGQRKFEANCMACHGKHATGTKQGPPLVHIIYEPNHHSDLSFHRAAKYGVRAHHWPFGDMAPVSNVKEEDVTMIIRYVRELQRANGIN